MAVNGRRPSLSSQRSFTVGDLLSTLLIPILLLTSTPYTRSQNVRLEGGNSSEGRLEVYYSRRWGTVCSDFFDYIDAGVVCHSLGFGYRGTVIGNQYGPGTGDILLDNVQCVGYETLIADCPHGGWTYHNCDHSKDVSVSCGKSPVQRGPLRNADNFFIVADRYLRNIYQVDATSGATAQLLPFGAASQPRAVAYDPTAKLIYWTDVSLHTINRYSLLTNNNTVIHRDPSNTAAYDGLAIDVGRQKLYYADASGKVGELNTNGTGHRVLINDRYSRPRGVVIDVDNRVLYWTDWSQSRPAIYRSSVINPARETLINGRRNEAPNALAIDFTAGVMYWGDAYFDKIETAYFNGTGRMTLLTETGTHYFAFALHDGDLYFTDWNEQYIRRMNISTSSTSMISSSTRFHRLNGIIFVPGSPSPTTTPTSRDAEQTADPFTPPPSSTASNDSPATQSPPVLSGRLLIVIVASIVGLVIIIIIIVIIVVCLCVRRKRRQKQQQQQQQPGPQQPQLMFGVVPPMYEEIQCDNKKNETYEHPNFKPASAEQSPYEDLEHMRQPRYSH